MRSIHLTLLSVAVAGLALAPLAGAADRQTAPRAAGQPVYITSLPYTIEQPGAYALGGNLAGSRGIIVAANRVSIDLGGFELTGREDSTDAILVRGVCNDLEIRNGSISSWGGVAIQAESAFNSSFHDLRLSASGLCGLRAGHGAVVENVVSQSNGGIGIQGAEAMVVSDCSAAGNVAWGFELGKGSNIHGCSALNNRGGGIFVDGGSLVRGNTAYGNGWQWTDAANSGCGAATLAGIAAVGEGSRVDGNTVCHNTIGLQLHSGGNSVSENMVTDNDTNYQFEPGNMLELMLCELPQTISWPAKVTLAGTLTGVAGEDGITVDADGVTIDMLDHGLIGVPGSLSGIRILAGHSTFHVMDGFVRDWGNCGLNSEGAMDGRVVQVCADGNGVDGLRIGPSSLIIDCTASHNGADGMKTDQDCTVTGVTSNSNGKDGVELGLHSNITGSTASENLVFGLRAGRGSHVAHSTASRNNMGIAVTVGCTVESCTTSFNTVVGIRAEKQCLLLSNLSDQNGTGIFVSDGPGTRVEGNNLSNNQLGLSIAAAGNLAIRNSSWADVLAYSFDPGCSFGPVVDLTAGGMLATENPWANFKN